MRRRKSFVQIQVHHINAEISRPRDASQRVHVRAVHIQQCAFGVQNFRNLRNALLKNSQRGRIGDHQRRDIRRNQFAQLIDVNLSVRFGLDVFHFVAGNHGGGRIGAVGRVRDQNFLPRISLFFQVCANQQ